MSTVKTPQVQTWPLSWIATTLVAANLALICLVVASLYTFGSVGSALGYLRGERLFADTLSVETATGGEPRQIDLVITNTSGRPVRILGGSSSCSCLVPLDVPAVLPAKDTSRIRTEFRPKGRTGRFSLMVRLFTDHPGQQYLDVWVKCNVAGTVASAKKQLAPRGG
jgi:Protein of unknown function (DUF1573)